MTVQLHEVVGSSSVTLRCVQQGNGGPFHANGFFDTGDMGYMDSEGWLYITGRSKEVRVCVGGVGSARRGLRGRGARGYSMETDVVWTGD